MSSEPILTTPTVTSSEHFQTLAFGRLQHPIKIKCINYSFFFFSPCGILLIIFEQKKKKIGILIHQSTNHGNKFLSTWELMDLIYFHFPLCKTISVSLHKSAFSKWMEGGQNTASKTGTLFLKWKFSGYKMNKSIALKKVDLTLFFCVKSSSL